MSHLRQTWNDIMVNRDIKTMVAIVATFGVIAAVTALIVLANILDNNLFTDHALRTPLTYTVTPAPTAPKHADAAQPVNPPGTLPPYDVDSDPTMFHHLRP